MRSRDWSGWTRRPTAVAVRASSRRPRHTIPCDPEQGIDRDAQGNRKTRRASSASASSSVRRRLQRALNEFQRHFNPRWQETDLFSPGLQAAIEVLRPAQHSLSNVYKNVLTAAGLRSSPAISDEQRTTGDGRSGVDSVGFGFAHGPKSGRDAPSRMRSRHREIGRWARQEHREGSCSNDAREFA
jgi:hypothetical protein